MSAWRRQALTLLPEYRRIIGAAGTPMALWVELGLECNDACVQQNEELARRFFVYAWWCWESPSLDVRTAVAFAFYEHLPIRPEMRRDLPRYLSRTAFMQLREVFRYHLSPEEMVAFEREFLRDQAQVGKKTT